MAISATGSSTGQGLRPASPPCEPAGVPIVDGLVITHSVTLEPGVYNVEDIAEDGLIFIAGNSHTCALRTNGLWTRWRKNHYGQLNGYRATLPLVMRNH